jgi:hypothetical protein
VGSEYGRRVMMPCSHPGEVVVGTFAVCTVKGCDGNSKSQPSRQRQSCPKCYSLNVEAFEAANVPTNAMHCRDCGKCWWDP